MENNLDSPVYNQFQVNLDGYEGPLDLLLELAKSQKVDLSNISILKLTEQYLKYINVTQNLNIEVASDYLVMAAWLVYLKSRLLLPKKQNEEEPSTKDLEEALKFQLARLESMRKATLELFKLPQVGRDIFYRGFSDGTKYKYKIHYTSTLYDLLKAYTMQSNRSSIGSLKIQTTELYSVDEAINRIKNIFGNFPDWIELSKLFPLMGKNQLINKSAISSTFLASLELAKNGFLLVKQDYNYGPIMLKMKND